MNNGLCKYRRHVSWCPYTIRIAQKYSPPVMCYLNYNTRPVICPVLCSQEPDIKLKSNDTKRENQ